jgi:hypothetical protein
MLGAEFVMDDFMLAASGQHRGLPVFTGVQYAQSHPREAKMIAMLKYGVELSNDVIATIIGCSPQTVTAVCNLEEMKADVDGFKKLIKHRVRKLKLLLFTELEQDILDPDKLAEMDAFQKLALLSRIEEAEKSLGVGDGAGDGATPQGGAVQSKTISEERRKAAREELARMTKVVEVTDSATHAERA